MDSRAKQRLTGAIILAALFVLLVPELLTGPKSASTPATPAEEEGLRSYTIDIDGKSAAAAPAATSPVPATPLARPNDSAPAPAPAPEVPTTEPAAAAAVPEAPVASTPPPSASSAPPAAAQSPTARAAPAQAAAGSFVVQLGSFGSRDNADRLVRDMSAKGFKAFVAPITSGGRELYRVRVGPTHDRASAEALAADLKRVGQSGSIVPIS